MARRRSSFGVELGRLLLEHRVTYRELSRRTGLAPQTLHRYALGVRRPEDETLELIAAALELEPEDLIEWRRRRVIDELRDERLVAVLYPRLRHRDR
jgi:transcriptional regulator with XRE-family HTH domain